MAQNVSELWSTIWGTRNTKREYAFDIEGVWYGPDAEVEHKAESALYSDFGIGNAAASSLSLGLYADDIPRAAKIKRYIRLVNGDKVSEWLPKGVFFARTRGNDDGYWTVEAVNAMYKADAVWEPDQSLEFPMPMTEAVEIIASLMGVEIDARTVLNAEYTIDYPVSKQTLRKTLGWIAAAHGGNFRMTDEGKLLLVPLISAPAETNYLVDETGSTILIGGAKILVDDAASGPGNSEGAKHYVGLDITGFTNNGKYKPVSRVTLLLDDENALTAGDDTGFEIVADCPYATQEMVDALLAALKGYEYQAFEAEEANIDPAAELGDGVTVNGIYSVIAKISDDGEGYPSLAAPGEAELEGDLLLGGPLQQEFSRKIAETNSLISKTAEQIRQEVSNEVEGLTTSFTIELDSISAEIESVDGRVTSLDMGLDGIQTQVTGLDSSVSALEQYVDSFTLSVSNGSTSSIIALKAGSATIASQTINMSGLVTYTGLSSGTTTVDGACIKTGTIDAERLNLAGAITFNDLSASVRNDINDAYTMAESAQDEALYASDQVDAWSYNGGTYIDGSMIMAGTVMASYLLGGYVGLLDAREREIGSIEITKTSTGYGVEIYTEYGGVKIDSGGNVFISSIYNTRLQLDDEAAKLGPTVMQTDGTIITSDRNLKHDIEYDMAAYDALFDALKPCRFKYDEGTSDRYHTALIAQDVKDALLAAGLTTQEFAGYCERPVYALDEEGNRTAEVIGSTCALRYDEFIALNIRQIQLLKARVAELEAKLL